ncbi:nuclear transport factor 2 family protein [Boseongicola aestuarii]|uniref:SnoaL-like domain protein n=1 Tax=Boseongicola aestuarii TaxID=1470561 RepID=A0A238J1E9_9RHOB|nr:nuclear transport factor 2 family protein [Boseongicola aestuarii]SMX24062.1 SnoaL-like domain protein [Boseongicola aestuarii]
MKILKRAAALVMVCLFATQAFPGGHALSTEEVLNKHLTSFGAGDVDAIMEDYTEDSVIILQSGVLAGPDAIRGLFDALVAEFSKPGMTFSLDATHINEDVAFIVWHAETADNVYEYATDTFVIKDGKIRTQTVAFAASAK